MDRSADGHPACERIRGHGGSVSDPSGVARMTPPGEVIVAPLVRDRRQVLTDLVALTKPRVVLMVLVTTLVGYYVGLTGAPDWVRLLHLALGTVLAAGGTLALNQYWERDVDARMERTRARPLPDGRLMPLEALVFGGSITAAGIVYLAAFRSEERRVGKEGRSRWSAYH